MALKILASTVVGVAALALASSASANNFVFSLALDPAVLSVGGLNSALLDTPTAIGVGDTVDLTITFTGGQTVSFAGGTDLWTGLLDSDSAALDTTGVLSFIGGSANLHTTDPVSQQNEYVHAGNFYSNSSFASDGNSFSFSGIEQVFTIVDNVPFTTDSGDHPPGPDPRTYETGFLYFDGAISTGGAPEPATWALMLGGFGLAGAMLRRRTALAG